MGRSDGGLAQLGERGVRNAEVEGSNPLPSTIPKRKRPGHHAPAVRACPLGRYGTLTEVLSPELLTVNVPADATGV